MGSPVPDTYNLSKSYRYGKEILYVFTDGENYIFSSGILEDEGTMDARIVWITVSEPTKIGNAPT